MKTAILLFLLCGIGAFPVGAQSTKKQEAEDDSSATIDPFLQTGVLTPIEGARNLINQLDNIVVIDAANATDAKCEVIQNGIGNRSIVNSFGDVVGYNSHGVLQIHGKEHYVEQLPSWELSSDEKVLILIGSVPNSHRGGSLAVQFIALDEYDFSELIKCSSTISSRPVIGENGTIWVMGYHYNANDSAMSLMNFTKEGDVLIKVPLGYVGMLGNAQIKLSPNGRTLLLSGQGLGFGPTVYLYEVHESGALTEVKGLYSHNVWVTERMVFSVQGESWMVFDIENHESHVKSGMFEQGAGTLRRCFSLPNGQILMLFAHSVENSPSLAVIFDWETNSAETFWIRCPMKFYGHIRCGINRDGNVWIYEADASVLLSRE
jgi:hypothetical protein